VCPFCGECARSHARHRRVVANSSDLTDAQWSFLEPLLLISSKRGPKHGDDLRHVVDAMLYISHTGCQWRFLPEEFGPWTRVWSQFRRWSKNGTWSRVLTALHASSRTALGRKDPRPSMVVIDTHLARGASNGGVTFHNQGGPTVGPTAPNGSSASTSRACHSACESSPLRPPRPVPSNRYSTTSPARRGRTTGARAR